MILNITWKRATWTYLLKLFFFMLILCYSNVELHSLLRLGWAPSSVPSSVFLHNILLHFHNLSDSRPPARYHAIIVLNHTDSDVRTSHFIFFFNQTKLTDIPNQNNHKENSTVCFCWTWMEKASMTGTSIKGIRTSHFPHACMCHRALLAGDHSDWLFFPPLEYV